MKYQSNSQRSLSVLGFTKAENVPFSRLSGDQVLVIVAREGDEVRGHTHKLTHSYEKAVVRKFIT